MYGNASLSYYDPEKNMSRMKFSPEPTPSGGDVAQSMVIRNGIGWIVVNNSGVIYAIDINTPSRRWDASRASLRPATSIS